jgi:hypothetical protein
MPKPTLASALLLLLIPITAAGQTAPRDPVAQRIQTTVRQNPLDLILDNRDHLALRPDQISRLQSLRDELQRENGQLAADWNRQDASDAATRSPGDRQRLMGLRETLFAMRQNTRRSWAAALEALSDEQAGRARAILSERRRRAGNR